MSALKWKICGMRDPDNIVDVLGMEPDYIGFIFYERSSRYVGDSLSGFVSPITTAKKVGVFVDAELEKMEQAIDYYHLDAVQLHGNEEVLVCKDLKARGVEVIKAFGVSEGFDWDALAKYVPEVDYFLFDTKHISHGGSGQVFDWELLKDYPFHKPYFLSGGIDVHNLSELMKIADERLYAIDVNSRFEISPGLKDIALLREARKLLKQKDQSIGTKD